MSLTHPFHGISLESLLFILHHPILACFCCNAQLDIVLTVICVLTLSSGHFPIGGILFETTVTKAPDALLCGHTPARSLSWPIMLLYPRHFDGQ